MESNRIHTNKSKIKNLKKLLHRNAEQYIVVRMHEKHKQNL